MSPSGVSEGKPGRWARRARPAVPAAPSSPTTPGAGSQPQLRLRALSHRPPSHGLDTGFHLREAGGTPEKNTPSGAQDGKDSLLCCFSSIKAVPLCLYDGQPASAQGCTDPFPPCSPSPPGVEPPIAPSAEPGVPTYPCWACGSRGQGLAAPRAGLGQKVHLGDRESIWLQKLLAFP